MSLAYQGEGKLPGDLKVVAQMHMDIAFQTFQWTNTGGSTMKPLI